MKVGYSVVGVCLFVLLGWFVCLVGWLFCGLCFVGWLVVLLVGFVWLVVKGGDVKRGDVK